MTKPALPSIAPLRWRTPRPKPPTSACISTACSATASPAAKKRGSSFSVLPLFSSFSPCGRRCPREARADEGFSPRRQTPHPSRCRFAPIADAKHRRPFLSTAADGRLCHLLPQGEKGRRRAAAKKNHPFLSAPTLLVRLENEQPFKTTGINHDRHRRDPPSL